MLRGYAISTLGELAACLVNAGINRDDLVEWIQLQRLPTRCVSLLPAGTEAQSKAEDSARQIERRKCEVNLLSMELAKSERDSAERDSALAGRRRLIDEL